jgi:hypothetical protein
MDEHEHSQHLQEGHDHSKDHHSPWHRLKRIHHSWIFWIFLLLMLAAITFYIMSDNFSLVPHNQMKEPIESPAAP